MYSKIPSYIHQGCSVFDQTKKPRWIPYSDHSQKNETIAPCASKQIRMTYITDTSLINIDELAFLFSRCAVHAPGNALHNTINQGELSAHFKTRVQTAVSNSLACVAAYIPEAHLPQESKALAWRRLRSINNTASIKNSNPMKVTASMNSSLWDQIDDVFYTFTQSYVPTLNSSAMNERRKSRLMQDQVLVGFARAVGDAALVATIHDIAVAPEFRRCKLGSTLLDKLTKTLYDMDIIDVGVVVPDSAEAFFESCSFGDDSEESVVMVLKHANS